MKVILKTKKTKTEQKSLKTWLKSNIKELNQTLPFLLEWQGKEEQNEIYSFTGINEHLLLFVNKESAQLKFKFQQDMIDILADFHAFPTKSENGKFYCLGCARKKFYDLKTELLQEHFRNALIRFQKKNFLKQNFVLMCGSKDRSLIISKVIKVSELKLLDQLNVIFRIDQTKSWILPYAVESILL